MTFKYKIKWAEGQKYISGFFETTLWSEEKHVWTDREYKLEIIFEGEHIVFEGLDIENWRNLANFFYNKERKLKLELL